MVCPYDWSIPGGVQTQVSGLAAALVRAGADVTVVTPLGDESSRPATVFDVIGVGRSVNIPANGSRAPVALTPAAMARTIRALRLVHPDVVHIHEPLAPGPSVAALIAGPRPIVATFHRSGSDPWYRVEGLALRRLVGRMDAAVAVSEAARETAAQVLGPALASIPVIPNGVDVRRYALVAESPESPEAPEAPASTEQESGGDAEPATVLEDQTPEDEQTPLTILFVGRHEERKGLAVLLRAVEILRADAAVDVAARTARVQVVGSGPQTAELRHRFSGLTGLEWLGAVDDEEKALLLRSADVFVAPSMRGESFGVVLLEAMAAGTAVVASDLPGYRLAAGEAVRWVAVGDAQALAGVLAEVLSAPAELERLVGLGDDRVAAYSLDFVARRYLDLYRRILASRRVS